MRVELLSPTHARAFVESPSPRGPNLREHRMVRATRVKRERFVGRLVAATLLKALGLGKDIDGYLRVTFVRHGITCDDDNLAGAFKAYRDGLADAVGVDDKHTHQSGKTRRVYEFTYKQGPSQRTRTGFELEIEHVAGVRLFDVRPPDTSSWVELIKEAEKK